jgi:DNA-binding CsgD family transcriptional regulator/tetratricopeptide (TPR) repeat protein
MAADPIVRELCQLLPGILPLPVELAPAPATLDPAEKKRCLFAALTHFFLHHASHQPLLVILEDLHWSDEASLEYLQHLARQIATHPMLLLATYRSDETHAPLRHLLAYLDRERLAQEFALQRLPREDIAAMLRAIFALDRPVRVEFLDAIYALTEGNPFFIEEVLTSLIASGDIFYRDGGWDRKPIGELRIPRSVQDAVAQRTAPLSEPARELLRLAAVVGRRFDFAFLQALSQHDEARLLALLKELLATGLVVEETADQFAFRHALTREAIYAELLARERRALHQAIVETMERQYVAALEARLPDLAHHSYLASRWEQALAYGRAAGERALALYAPHAAIEQFTHALEAAQRLGMPAPLAVLGLRGQAYEWVGDFDAAGQDYEAALAQARAAHDRQSEWRILLDLGLLWAGRDYLRSRDYYQCALDLARTLDQGALLAHNLNRLGNWYTNADLPRDGQRYHQEALTIFDALGDRHGRAATLDLLAIAACVGGDLVQMVVSYRQAVELFEELDERRSLVSCLATLAAGGGILHSSTVLPAIPSSAAVREGERALMIAREIGRREGEAYAQTVLGSHLGTQGEYGRALLLVRNALAIAEEIEHRAWIAQAHQTLGALYLDLLAPHAAQQHLEHALALAQELSSTYRLRVVTGALAAAYIAANQLARAETALGAMLGRDTPAETLGQRLCWCARAELALARSEPDQALVIADRLLATAVYTGSADQAAVPRLALLRGEALAALGRVAEAEAALEAARAGALRQGARPLLWRVHVALGRLYRTQDRQADAERAFGDAGMVIDELAASIPDHTLRETFRRAATVQLPQPRPQASNRVAPRAFGLLSPREREVAALIAQGKTNGEIAATLVVSKRTVETHVGSILSKLGFTTRAQVIASVLGEGLANGDEAITS